MNQERVLAHIEIIDWIKPIEGADFLELAGILGWQCVVKKGEFKVGDKIIYCEIDSVLPPKPEFEFLKKYNYRIKTQKLRGELSQGLVISVPKEWDVKRNDRCRLGSDVTEELGITKYLSPSEREEIIQEEKKISNEKNKLKKFMMRYSWFRKLFLSRKQKSGFPYWVSKTDETRVQNLHWEEFYEQFKDKEVYVTEKVDYCSGTFTGKLVPKYPMLKKFSPKKYQFVVASRNLTNNDKNSIYWKIVKKYNLEQILKDNPTLTIQGECGDTKIQGNKYGIKEPKMWVFNIIDHVKNYHYNYDEILNFCKKYNLNTVPLIEPYTFTKSDKTYKFPPLSILGSTVQEFVEFSKGKSVINPKIEREGIVVRCIENGKKIFSFKAINPDFLLHFNE